MSIVGPRGEGANVVNIVASLKEKLEELAKEGKKDEIIEVGLGRKEVRRVEKSAIPRRQVSVTMVPVTVSVTLK